MTFYNDTRARFLEKLLAITPKNLKRAFLCNSGTEAIEAAIKFARFTTKKKEFITHARFPWPHHGLDERDVQSGIPQGF
jgi:acetylornithine/LysW-gamma-L-lysine aminotransferase